MVIVVETKWKMDGKLYGGATHQVVNKDLHASQKIDDAVAMAKGMTTDAEVAFVRSRSMDMNDPQVGKATLG